MRQTSVFHYEDGGWIFVVTNSNLDKFRLAGEILSNQNRSKIMRHGKKIDIGDHIAGFKEEISDVANRGKDAFFGWFDNADNTDMAFVRGQWDFMVHIGMPLSSHIVNPEDKTALEIGYGGGRILAAASKSFKKVIGIDIHNNGKLVKTELEQRGISNFELIKSDGSSIPVGDSKMDVVYSFIVLQHVEKFSIFKRYLEEAYRVLKPGGVSILYFGRKYFFSAGRNSKILYWVERVLEGAILCRGFKEFHADINCTNLIVSLRCAAGISKEIGFDVLGRCVSHKDVPNGISLYGGQHGIILQKR